MTWNPDRLNFTPAARILVANGKPVDPTGEALLRHYNAHPPQGEEGRAVVSGDAVGEELRLRAKRKGKAR